MRKITALLILLSILFTIPLSACGEEEELGEWQMPEVDARPTAAPTARGLLQPIFSAICP